MDLDDLAEGAASRRQRNIQMTNGHAHARSGLLSVPEVQRPGLSSMWPFSALSRVASAGAASDPTAPVLHARVLVAVQAEDSLRWQELIVLLPLGDYTCVVANWIGEIQVCTLNEDFAALVVATASSPRPIVDLLECGSVTDSFDSGPLGEPPSGARLQAMLRQAESLVVGMTSGGERDDSDGFSDFGGGYLRGGGPLPFSRQGQGVATGKHKDPDEMVWIAIYHDASANGASVPLGTIIRPTRSLQRLGHLALDKDSDGGIYVLQKCARNAVSERSDEAKARMLAAAGGGDTPRGEAPKKGLQTQIDQADQGGSGGSLPPGEVDGLIEDHRLFEISFDNAGDPHRDFFETVRVLPEDAVVGWPLTGPRSLRWILRFIGAQCNTGPTGRLHQFMALTKLTFQDKYVSEYSVLCKVLELAVSFDQLKVSNLACIELVARRLQLIEEKYRFRMPQMEGGANATDPEQDHSLFMGLGTGTAVGRMSVMVMPQLSAYIGEELAKEAAVTKGRVKAHELRASLQKINGGKGKAKGDDG